MKEIVKPITVAFELALARQVNLNQSKLIWENDKKSLLDSKKILVETLTVSIKESFEKEDLKAEILNPGIIFYEEDEEACSLLEKIVDASLSIISTKSEDVGEINIRINHLPKFLSPVLLSRFFQRNGIDISISFFTKFNDYCLVKKT